VGGGKIGVVALGVVVVPEEKKLERKGTPDIGLGEEGLVEEPDRDLRLLYADLAVSNAD
jgi:hypothetical protein